MAKKRARLLYQALIDGLSYLPNNVIEAEAAVIKKLEDDGIADAAKAAVDYCLNELDETVKDHEALLLAAMRPEDRHALLVDGIMALDADNTALFTDDGKPQVKALEEVVGFTVSAAERDDAWAEVESDLDDEAGIVS